MTSEASVVKKLHILLMIGIFTAILTTPRIYSQDSDSLLETEYSGAANLELKQAILKEIADRRGLDSSKVHPDDLIHSAADISETFQVSCEISGACTDKDGNSAHDQLSEIPDYDEEKGFLNAQKIRAQKSGG